MEICARDYISPRQRPLTAAEKLTRSIAYDLKTGEGEAVKTAAAEMAALIAGRVNVILVPVPDSRGDTGANMRLCRGISEMLGKEKVSIIDLLKRSAPVVSQCMQRRQGKKISYSVEQHGICADAVFCKMLAAMCNEDGTTLVYVDNVLSTGSTVRACIAATGIPGDALVFAKIVEIKKPTTCNGGKDEDFRMSDTG